MVGDQLPSDGTVAAAMGRSSSLAVRFRPRRFADVVGQRHVTAVLKAAIAARTPPVQLLFSGGSGLGKTTVARLFAAALNCENPADDGDCCAVCPSCVEVFERRHPDVIEMDAASNGGKDEINEMALRAATLPLRSSFKLYIVDEAHGLSRAGGEAFLKLLEEPPPHVLFVLATTDAHKMLATNRGRCQVFEFVPPSRAELAENLVRVAHSAGWSFDAELAELVLSASDVELGVRGSVMTLSKLAPLLDAGPVSCERAAEVLGVVASSALGPLLAAIDTCDRPAAASAVRELLRTFRPARLRAALVAHARQLVAANVDDSTLFFLQHMVDCRDSADDLLLTVCELASPSLRGADGLGALVATAEQLAAKLELLIGQAGALSGLNTPVAAGPTGSLVADAPVIVSSPPIQPGPPAADDNVPAAPAPAAASAQRGAADGPDRTEVTATVGAGTVPTDRQRHSNQPRQTAGAATVSSRAGDTGGRAGGDDEPGWWEGRDGSDIADDEDLADASPAPTPPVSKRPRPASTSPSPTRSSRPGGGKPPAPARRPVPSRPRPPVDLPAGLENDPWFSDPEAHTSQPDDPLADLFAALAVASQPAFVLLRQMDVELVDGCVRVLVPTELVERAGDPEFQTLVKTAAAGSLRRPVRWFRQRPTGI